MGQMPLGEFLEQYPMEILVHTWDLAQATGQAAVLDPDLVRDALGRRGSLLRWPVCLAWSVPNAPWPRTPTISLGCWRSLAAVTPTIKDL
jgi:hypothetical protein